MNYDCLYLVLNGAELLFGSFLQNAHAVAHFWLGFANRILATWKLVVKQSTINLPVTSVCLGEAIMVLSGQGMYL